MHASKRESRSAFECGILYVSANAFYDSGIAVFLKSKTQESGSAIVKKNAIENPMGT